MSEKLIDCPTCDGTGQARKTYEAGGISFQKCQRCNGPGDVRTRAEWTRQQSENSIAQLQAQLTREREVRVKTMEVLREGLRLFDNRRGIPARDCQIWCAAVHEALAAAEEIDNG
jgi:DnaJ-class molecular chaperone